MCFNGQMISVLCKKTLHKLSRLVPKMINFNHAHCGGILGNPRMQGFLTCVAWVSLFAMCPDL